MYSNLDKTSTCELKASSSEPPNETRKIDSIEKSVRPEIVTSELPEESDESSVISELNSDPRSELSLIESNNHPTVPAVDSELPNDLSSSPLKQKENQNSLASQELTGAALARRLNVSPSTLRHKKNARNFGQWTSGHDPDGIAWYFDGQKFISKTNSHIQ